MRHLLAYGLIAVLLFANLAADPTSAAPDRNSTVNLPSTCYLFSYFIDNGEDGLHLAWSRDGFKWEALNGGKSFLAPQVGTSKLMRDPCLLLGPDGVFRMTWTDGWKGPTIGYASSRDLLTWSPQKTIPVMTHEPGCRNCWAPEVIYNAARKNYLIIWSSTITGKFPKTAGSSEDDYNHRIYATTTIDFETFTPATLFFDPGFNVIDATILPVDGKFYLIFKDERRFPAVRKDLRLATSDKLEGPYGNVTESFTMDWVEGPTAIKIGNDYVVYYDCYTKGHFGALRSRDLRTWEDITAQLSMPHGVRHGTVLKVPGQIIAGLLAAENKEK